MGMLKHFTFPVLILFCSFFTFRVVVLNDGHGFAVDIWSQDPTLTKATVTYIHSPLEQHYQSINSIHHFQSWACSSTLPFQC
mmetsp:Transcript_15765/g.38807  ORF Transcript_15765/g.38807 Transcript_15765/m.38807 type:complete len:82 (-) Transcript_15765:87-332(-)